LYINIWSQFYSINDNCGIASYYGGIASYYGGIASYYDGFDKHPK
jgi:hypothetical protein